MPGGEKEHLQPYFEKGKQFHGYLSPGLAIGIFMVDLAKDILGPHELVDAVVETNACIPDAVQIMTSCTYGNKWMRVKEWGKFALTLYDKQKLDGVRVHLDIEKVKNYPRLYQWYMRQGRVETEEVISEIMEAGRAILSWQRVKVKVPPKEKKVPVSVCPSCGESHPASDGALCLKCSGKDDYYQVITP